jgi:hypothetical protein
MCTISAKENGVGAFLDLAHCAVTLLWLTQPVGVGIYALTAENRATNH